MREATSADQAGIQSLLIASLGAGSGTRTEAFWRWKHEHSPFGRSPILVAEHDGQVIGLRAFVRWCWHRGSATVPAVRAVDTATHPGHRGGGVFSRLTMGLVERMRAEGVTFVFNTPNEQSRPGYLKMGWRSLGRCSLMVRPFLRPRLLQAFGRQIKRGSRQASVPLGSTGSGRPVGDLLDSIDTNALSKDTSESTGQLTTVPTSEYLAWRYRDIPGIQYRAAWAGRGAGQAAVVYRMTGRGDLREMHVSQLLINTNRESVRTGSELLRSAMAGCEPDVAIAMAARGTRERTVLRSAGFLPAPRTGPILTVRDLAGTAPTRHEQFRLSLGEIELF